MQTQKISIVTVVKNGMPYLTDSIKSFQLQSHENKEHVIIYSNSSDDTENYLKKINLPNIKIYKHDDSKNLYHSLNKGIELCSGQIIGLLHSDDIFYEADTLKHISNLFTNNFDCIYGDIVFSKRNDISTIQRVWKSKVFNENDIKLGWLPPHTSIFLKRKFFENIKYDTEYKISSDFDFVLKIINNKSIKIKYIDRNLCIMRLGGKSTSIKHFFKKLKEDIKISKKYFRMNYIYVFLKIIRKLCQLKFFNKKIQNEYLQKICSER